jgi:hypothetical protein
MAMALAVTVGAIGLNSAAAVIRVNVAIAAKK